MSRSYHKVAKYAVSVLRPRDSENKGENLAKPRFTKVVRKRVWTQFKDRTIVQWHRQRRTYREKVRERLRGRKGPQE